MTTPEKYRFSASFQGWRNRLKGGIQIRSLELQMTKSQEMPDKSIPDGLWR